MVWIVSIIVVLMSILLILMIWEYLRLIRHTQKEPPKKETDLGNRFNIPMMVLCVVALAVTAWGPFHAPSISIVVWELGGVSAIVASAVINLLVKKVW